MALKAFIANFWIFFEFSSEISAGINVFEFSLLYLASNGMKFFDIVSNLEKA